MAVLKHVEDDSLCSDCHGSTVPGNFFTNASLYIRVVDIATGNGQKSSVFM